MDQSLDSRTLASRSQDFLFPLSHWECPLFLVLKNQTRLGLFKNLTSFVSRAKIQDFLLSLNTYKVYGQTLICNTLAWTRMSQIKLQYIKTNNNKIIIEIYNTTTLLHQKVNYKKGPNVQLEIIFPTLYWKNHQFYKDN